MNKPRLAVILCVAMIGCATAPSNDWRSLHRTNFPARVAAVQFGNLAIDDSGTMQWGRWMVGLDTRTKAVDRSNPQKDIRFIDIEPLFCSNEVAGKNDCHLSLRYYDGSWHCFFFGMGAGDAVRVTCPSGLRFR